MRHRRGFMLALSLMLTILIAVIALGLMGLRQGNYAASRGIAEAAQARALAVAGLEDIRVKLSKDPFFPTGIGDEQVIFSFTERVARLSDDESIGSYRITIDRTHRQVEKVIRIESRGMLGEVISEGATFTIYAELDLNDFSFAVWEEGAVSRL